MLNTLPVVNNLQIDDEADSKAVGKFDKVSVMVFSLPLQSQEHLSLFSPFT